MSHIRCITINTDASFYNEYKTGGWAVWIVCDNFRIKQSGGFKNIVYNSHDAEIKCIANAFHILLKREDITTIKHLVINTDSTTAIERIRGSKTDLGKEVNKLYKLLISKFKISSYKFKHVKGHTNNKNSRSYVNNWCDKNAKIQAKLKIEKIKKDEFNKKYE